MSTSNVGRKALSCMRNPPQLMYSNQFTKIAIQKPLALSSNTIKNRPEVQQSRADKCLDKVDVPNMNCTSAKINLPSPAVCKKPKTGDKCDETLDEITWGCDESRSSEIRVDKIKYCDHVLQTTHMKDVIDVLHRSNFYRQTEMDVNLREEARGNVVDQCHTKEEQGHGIRQDNTIRIGPTTKQFLDTKTRMDTPFEVLDVDVGDSASKKRKEKTTGTKKTSRDATKLGKRQDRCRSGVTETEEQDKRMYSSRHLDTSTSEQTLLLKNRDSPNKHKIKRRMVPSPRTESGKTSGGESEISDFQRDPHIGGSEQQFHGVRSESSLVCKRDSWIWFSPEMRPSVENFAARQRTFKSRDPRVAELAEEISKQEEMNRDIERTAESLIDSSSTSTSPGNLQEASSKDMSISGLQIRSCGVIRNRMRRKSRVVPYKRSDRKLFASPPLPPIHLTTGKLPRCGESEISDEHSTKKASSAQRLTKLAKTSPEKPNVPLHGLTISFPQWTKKRRRNQNTVDKNRKYISSISELRTTPTDHSKRCSLIDPSSHLVNSSYAGSFSSEQIIRQPLTSMSLYSPLYDNTTLMSSTQCSLCSLESNPQQSGKAIQNNEMYQSLTDERAEENSQRNANSFKKNAQINQSTVSVIHSPGGTNIDREKSSRQHSPDSTNIHREKSSRQHSPGGTSIHREKSSRQHSPGGTSIHREKSSRQHSPGGTSIHREKSFRKHASLTSPKRKIYFEQVALSPGKGFNVARSCTDSPSNIVKKPREKPLLHVRASRSPGKCSLSKKRPCDGLYTSSNPTTEKSRTDGIKNTRRSPQLTFSTGESESDSMYKDRSVGLDSSYRQCQISKEVNTAVQRLLFDTEKSSSSHSPSSRSKIRVPDVNTEDERHPQEVPKNIHVIHTSQSLKKSTKEKHISRIPSPKHPQTELRGSRHTSVSDNGSPDIPSQFTFLDPSQTDLHSRVRKTAHKCTNIYARDYYLGKRVALKKQQGSNDKLDSTLLKKTDFKLFKTVSNRLNSSATQLNYSRPQLDNTKATRETRKRKCTQEETSRCSGQSPKPVNSKVLPSFESNDCSKISLEIISKECMNKVASGDRDVHPRTIKFADMNESKLNVYKIQNERAKNKVTSVGSLAVLSQSDASAKKLSIRKSFSQTNAPTTSVSTIFPRTLSQITTSSGIFTQDCKQEEGETTKLLLTASTNNSASIISYSSDKSECSGRQSQSTKTAQFYFVTQANIHLENNCSENQKCECFGLSKNSYIDMFENSQMNPFKLCTYSKPNLSVVSSNFKRESGSRNQDGQFKRNVLKPLRLANINSPPRSLRQLCLEQLSNTKAWLGFSGDCPLDTCRYPLAARDHVVVGDSCSVAIHCPQVSRDYVVVGDSCSVAIHCPVNDCPRVTDGCPRLVGGCSRVIEDCPQGVSDFRRVISALLRHTQQSKCTLNKDFMFGVSSPKIKLPEVAPHGMNHCKFQFRQCCPERLSALMMLPRSSPGEEGDLRNKRCQVCEETARESERTIPCSASTPDTGLVDTSTSTTATVAKNNSNPDSGYDESVSEKAIFDCNVQRSPTTVLDSTKTNSDIPWSNTRTYPVQYERKCTPASSCSDESLSSDLAHRSKISTEWDSEQDTLPSLSDDAFNPSNNIDHLSTQSPNIPLHTSLSVNSCSYTNDLGRHSIFENQPWMQSDFSLINVIDTDKKSHLENIIAVIDNTGNKKYCLSVGSGGKPTRTSSPDTGTAGWSIPDCSTTDSLFSMTSNQAHSFTTLSLDDIASEQSLKSSSSNADSTHEQRKAESMTLFNQASKRQTIDTAVRQIQRKKETTKYRCRARYNKLWKPFKSSHVFFSQQSKEIDKSSGIKTNVTAKMSSPDESKAESTDQRDITLSEENGQIKDSLHDGYRWHSHTSANVENVLPQSIKLPPTSSDEDDFEQEAYRKRISGSNNPMSSAHQKPTKVMKATFVSPVPGTGTYELKMSTSTNLPLRKLQFSNCTEHPTVHSVTLPKSQNFISSRSIEFSDILKRF